MAWNIDAISTFDPAQVGEVVTNEILQNTCDTLVDFDPADERKVVPLFAERWDVSPDRKEITFHLTRVRSSRPETSSRRRMSPGRCSASSS